VVVTVLVIACAAAGEIDMPRERVKTTSVPRVRTRVERSEPDPVKKYSYFADASNRTGLEFFSSGCVLLDMVLGGGFALGRMSNIIGDKSTGKTLLAIEAAVNFHCTFPDGVIRYLEAEAAFDQGYAAALGLPVDAIQWPKMEDKKGESDRTVEFLHDDIKDTVSKLKGAPCLYIVDSLDALSDRAEMGRDIADNTYGQNKAKKLGEMFRRLIGDIEQSRLCLLVISQIRDKIGVTFGETKMRAGGHAMDFYATHCLWLANVGQIKKTSNKIERPVGVDIRAKCKKNKIGLPFRECDFPVMFGYGVDDMTAAVEWLLAAGMESRLEDVAMTKAGWKIRVGSLRDKGGQEAAEVRAKLNAIIREEWPRLETNFLPKSGKY